MRRQLSRLKRHYDNLNIQTKFTLAILFAVIIPILALAVAFSGRLYDMIIADTIRNEQAASAQTAPLIGEALSRVTDAHGRITRTDYYQELFGEPVSEPLPSLAQTDEAFSFSDYAGSLVREGPVTAVKIYVDMEGQEAFFESESAKELFLPMSNAKGTYWYGIFQGSNSSSLYCPPFYLGSKEIRQYGDCAYITSETLHYRDTAYPCYVAVYYSSEPFRRILTDGIDFSGSVSYILNEREALVASTNDYLAGIYRLSYSDIRDSLMSSNNFMERSVLDEKIYVGFYYIQSPGWFMVTVLPSKPLIYKGNLAILKFVLICLFCILTAAGIAIWQARSITTRISSLVRQMAQIRKGPPVPMPSPVVRDEVGELINTYNYMTEKMNLLIDRQQKTAEELRIAEFNSLQAQINPHFLYNTMDMINWMALSGRTGEISNVVQSLARFYKLTLSRKKNFSTIENEIEHVSIYVQLQNMRYQNAIAFVVDIPDELLEYSIPKLTLQPIVENSILHGILEKEDKSGSVVITGWLQGEDILLMISDDGVGIPEEELPLILSDNNSLKKSGTNIAIYNIHKRLKLLYGPSYGLSYTSRMGQGTDVKICIPTHSAKSEDADSLTDPSSLLNSYHLSTVVDTNDPLNTEISSSELLARCRKLKGNTLTLKDLSDVALGFPSGEDLCLLYHEVTGDFPLHTHSYYEIAYVCEGDVEMTVDGRKLAMNTGHMIVFNTAAGHSIRYTEGPAVLLNICLHPGLLEGALHPVMENENILSHLFRSEEVGEDNYLFLDLSRNPKYISCLTGILETYILYDYHSSLELKSLLLYFLCIIICAENYRFQGMDERTFRMTRYIRQHGPSCTAEQAARHFGCSPEEVRSRILQQTGRNYEDLTN